MEEALRHRPRAAMGDKAAASARCEAHPRHFAGSRADARTRAAGRLRSMKSREYGGSTIGYWEMRISRLTLSFMSRPPIPHHRRRTRFGQEVRSPCPPASGRSLSCRARFCGETKSTCQIGHHFHRDHATVIRACRQVAARVATDAFFAELVSTLRVYLRARKRSPSYLTQSKPSARQSSAT